jgi:ferric-dicitrate binding protein FerR (iron transport regulator)
MPDERLLNALDEGIARLRAGGSVEGSVAASREIEDELHPLLDAAARLREAAPEHFPEDARDFTRARLMTGVRNTEAASMPARRRWSWQRALVGPGLIAAAVVLALLLSLRPTQAPNTAEAATTLTVLQGNVLVETSRGAIDGRSGAQLKAGDRVTTAAGSKAVLTFPDGSTVTLDADTEITIDAVLDSQGRVSVLLTQERGNTWTHVPPELGSRQIEIDTPTAHVETTQGAFSTNVEASSGRTEVGANTGSLQVTSGDQRTSVSQGSRTSVEASGAVAPTSPVAPATNELVIRVSGPAIAFVTDPGGATVGVLAPGVSVNQIPGATVTRDGSDLIIRIPEAAADGYTVGVHGTTGGSVQVTSASASGSTDTQAISIGSGQDYKLGLNGASGQLAPPILEQADAAKPANVTIPPLVIAAATASAARPEPSRTPIATSTQTPNPTSTPTSTAVPTKAPATPVPARTPITNVAPLQPSDATFDSVP